MNAQHAFDKIVSEVRIEAARTLRSQLSSAIMVGPFADDGLAPPGEEKGAGFAVFIGEWRLGWWATREEACEVGGRLAHALLDHPAECEKRWVASL